MTAPTKRARYFVEDGMFEELPVLRIGGVNEVAATNATSYYRYTVRDGMIHLGAYVAWDPTAIVGTGGIGFTIPAGAAPDFTVPFVSCELARWSELIPTGWDVMMTTTATEFQLVNLNSNAAPVQAAYPANFDNVNPGFVEFNAFYKVA